MLGAVKVYPVGKTDTCGLVSVVGPVGTGHQVSAAASGDKGSKSDVRDEIRSHFQHTMAWLEVAVGADSMVVAVAAASGFGDVVGSVDT